MEESTDHFKYEALNPLANEIRVLILEPYSKTESPAGVHCTLLNVCLDDPNRPSYEALSYVWGNASVTKPILLKGKPFTVTRALWTALRYLRLEDRQRTIWVDAICINQEDIHEREEHVRRMSEVYKNALHGLLWMDIPGAAIQHMLPLLKENYPEGETAAVDFALSLMQRADVRILREYSLLCADPVWGRSWIVQELILSPAVSIVTRDATFNVLHLQYLAMAASRFSFRGIHRLPEEERHRFGTISNMPPSSYSYRTADPPVTSIIRAWQYFSSCRSTDPRDRIYSLLSISGDHLGISPDYRISPKELYSKVARASIFQSKNLDVLCLGYLENTPMNFFTGEETPSKENLKQSLGIAEDGNLPSWLPLFNITGTPSSLLAVLGLEAKYSAGKWSSPLEFDQVKSYTNPDILSLTGVQIDTVGPIESPLYEVRPDMENVLLRNLVDSLPTKPYPKTYKFTGEDSFDAYWRTSIFDKSCTVGRLNHELKKSYRQIAASWIAVDSILQGSDYKNHPFLGDLEDGYPLPASHDVVYGMTLFKSSLARLVNYRFNITKEGYMAMIPRGAEEGDFICALLGSQVAHILRPMPNSLSPNTVTMIGLAYIHGFMDGEVLEFCKAGKLKAEVFHLV
jgi:hypothetical protein